MGQRAVAAASSNARHSDAIGIDMERFVQHQRFASTRATLPSRSYQPLAAVHDPDDRQHHRHLDQHADDGGERGAGLEAEQADGGGDGELEEVAGADQGRRAGDAVLLAGRRG